MIMVGYFVGLCQCVWILIFYLYIIVIMVGCKKGMVFCDGCWHCGCVCEPDILLAIPPVISRLVKQECSFLLIIFDLITSEQKATTATAAFRE